ncbi:NAD(P)-dependent oxidoreductase [Microbaculum marinum]|uniref:NAD(P)-dependent oxidoreductase n=1 Tax=Microbaculum marinum TaxID=1764581 RepID=A0AAW9RD71_9HYPH
MPDTPKVLIYAPREEPPETIRRLRETGCDLVFGDPEWQLPRGRHEDAFAEAARDAVALLGTSIRHTPISRRIMEGSQRLRVVSKYTVGVDDVDVAAATDLGILVCHSPTEANCFGVAEMTVAMMLAMLKKLRERDTAIREGRWREPNATSRYLGRRSSDGHPGITLGIVGLGRIGARFADLMRPWNIRILACDPYVQPMDFLLHGVERVDYETLLRESDVVSFHVVLNEETRYMLSDPQIALMKPNAVVLNTARGKVIDEAAVARAIAEGRLEGVGIDAFEEEPLAMDSPLRALGDRVLMLPHAAATNDGGELRAGIEMGTDAVIEVLAGRVPDNVFNKEVIPRWRERFGGVSLAG